MSYKKEANGELDITDSNDFYPFGMNFVRDAEENAYFGTGSYTNYKYNGKELQETGMYDYGWRQYMPDAARWMQLDPLVEDTEDPYAYVFNNPIKLTDPDGRAPEDGIEECCSNLKGFTLSMVDNVTGGNLTQKYNDGSAAYNDGVLTGNATSFIAGGLLMVTGCGDIGTGSTGLIASGGVSSTGGGVVVGGPGAVLSGGLILSGTLKMGLGGVMMYNSSQNLKNTKHTDNRHVDRTKYPEKSKYSKPAQKEKLQQRTVKNPDKVTEQGKRTKYEKTFKRVIGTKGETSHRVIVDKKKGKIVTSFPQKAN